MATNSLSFYYLEMSKFLPHFWRTVLLDIGFLVELFSLWIYWPDAFWPPKVLVRNLSAYCRSLVCDNSLSLLLSGLCLAFASLIIMCFSTSLSIFTLECIDLLGCFIFIFFMTFQMFLAIVSLPLCHFLWDSPDMVFHLMVAHRSLRLCSLQSFFSVSDSISTVLSSSTLILLPARICLWIPPVKFLFSFQLQNFLVSF